MFEVGWTEMLVIAIVMIVVVGPKDLPGMLRTFGRTVAKLRSMAGDFQKQFNDALKEAELDDVKKSVDALRGLNPAAEIKKQLNPFQEAAAEVRAGIDNAMKPKPAADPVPEAKPVEPLNGVATEAPAAGKVEAAPTFPAMTDSSVVSATAGSAAESPAAGKTTKRAASKPAVRKSASAKAATAQPAPTKAKQARPAIAKAEQPKAAPVKAAKPASDKKPATARKKTAGAAK